MTSQEKRWGNTYITIWQNFERNQRTFFSIKKPPIFGSWSWIFFWYKKFFADFPNFRTLISPELHLKKNWAKSENNFGTHPSIHPPSVTLRKYRGQKWADTASKLKSKKHVLGSDIKQKEIKGGPHRGPPKDGPPPGDKKKRGQKWADAASKLKSKKLFLDHHRHNKTERNQIGIP